MATEANGPDEETVPDLIRNLFEAIARAPAQVVAASPSKAAASNWRV